MRLYSPIPVWVLDAIVFPNTGKALDAILFPNTGTGISDSIPQYRYVL